MNAVGRGRSMLRTAHAGSTHWHQKHRSTLIIADLVPRRTEHRHISGLDSDLEAFSHNPSDGGLAPLAFQPSA